MSVCRSGYLRHPFSIFVTLLASNCSRVPALCILMHHYVKPVQIHHEITPEIETCHGNPIHSKQCEGIDNS